MGNVYFYCHQDSYAPNLSSSFESFSNLLIKCLVEGYGGKSPAGWSLAFYDSTSQVIVLRAGGGGRYYVRMQYGSGFYFGFAIAVYTSMSDKDTGTGRRPTEGSYFYRFAFLNYPPTGWAMVADNRSFWLGMGYSSNTQYANVTFLGELDQPQGSDNAFAIPWFVGSYSAVFSGSTSEQNRIDFENSATNTFYAYDSVFSPSGNHCTLTIRRPGGYISSSRSSPGQNSDTTSPEYSGLLLYSRLLLFEGQNEARYRGFLPGALELFHKNIASTISGSVGYSKTVLGGKNVVLFWNSPYRGSFIAIDLDRYRIFEDE